MDALGVPLTAQVAWSIEATGLLLLLASAIWMARGDDGGGTAPQPGAVESERDELLATISHELRSPLNAILGWAQVLELRRDLPADVVDGLQVIRRNALRQRQLLDEIADLSRVVRGALRIDARPMRLQDALDEACQAVLPDMDRKQVRFSCAPAVEAIIAGDRQRIQQVLANLLANAVRHTPPGGAIAVRTTVGDTHVSLQVSDTGAGIDPAFLPHVFEPFRQQPGPPSRDRTTLGLGLALVRLIVAGHGGQVTAESEGPGRGSTFTITLPLASEAAPTRGASGPVAAAAPLTGLRVLAVDDEADWRELLQHILLAAGAEARVAHSASEGLRIFDEWAPDVLLTDIAMPGLDGYAMLAAIRSRGGDAGALPAVAMTAHAGAAERARTSRAGFTEHLSKPVSPHDLIACVRRVAGATPLKARGGGAG
jgi:CheY-like chemotaxis protein/nitrogen-specific signal transduction histidine kinase